jgi:hypothetical protein
MNYLNVETLIIDWFGIELIIKGTFKYFNKILFLWKEEINKIKYEKNNDDNELR